MYVFSTLASVLLLAGALTAPAANLVVNPGFESGDLTGWSVAGKNSSPAENGIYYGVDDIDAHSGMERAYFGPVGGIITLSQAINTIPGTAYTVSFWLAQSPGTPIPYVNSFGLAFNGQTLYSQSNVPDGTYREYSFVSTPNATSSNLEFSFRDDTGNFFLDDVSVTAQPNASVPEPNQIPLITLALIVIFGKMLKRPDLQKIKSI